MKLKKKSKSTTGHDVSTVPPGDAVPSTALEGPIPIHTIKKSKLKRMGKWVLIVGLVGGGFALIFERVSHQLQAQHFQALAKKMSFQLKEGASGAISFPSDGPFDEQLGYTDIPSYIKKLNQQGFSITHQVQMSTEMMAWVEKGYFAPYHEKTQAGISILDCNQNILYQKKFPERNLARFEDLPPVVANTLLYIENRQLLDESPNYRNPAVEWSRLARAALEKGWNTVLYRGRTPGGSTLATQIEKYRHSPEGQTTSMHDKWTQMMSASTRAYLDGKKTSFARRQIVLEYLNTVPLFAKPGWGEVHGIGDALWVWFGVDFEKSKAPLMQAGDSKKIIPTADAAQLYKRILALLIAQRRPAFYLQHPKELEEAANTHLSLLAQEKIISPALRDAALKTRLGLISTPVSFSDKKQNFPEKKASNAVLSELALMLRQHNRYVLEHLDLSLQSTLSQSAQKAVEEVLRNLGNKSIAQESGLIGKGLLGKGDPAEVMYSFMLVEKGANANVLRVQADNLDKPLDLNSGMRMDLGSTAKLRTLVTYLDLIAQLHQKWAKKNKEELQKIQGVAKDPISQFALAYLLEHSAGNLEEMLQAALERTYSADPSEKFFTGGGSHTFHNFHKEDNQRIVTIVDALKDSLNLPFVRLMRDVVRYHRGQLDANAMLANPKHPKRKAYLERFAAQEGAVFLAKFYNRYKTLTIEAALEKFLNGLPSPYKKMAALRYLYPNESLSAIRLRLEKGHVGASMPSESQLKQWYASLAPGKFNLADRAFIIKTHPLELWYIAHQISMKGHASWTNTLASSEKERQAAYAWLLNSDNSAIQNSRISQMLDMDAFIPIQAQWAKMGYPFQRITPSYASALGASGDRPSSLAKLMGILVNQGISKPMVRINHLDFAKNTPYETRLSLKNTMPSIQVLPQEVAKVTLLALNQVVENGTARRIHHAFDHDGQKIKIGGKTGTGDQRLEVWGAGGQLIEERFVNRSATFVFNLNEQYFGTITAYVSGEKSKDYDFTSALSVQLLKIIAPHLKSLWGSQNSLCPMNQSLKK